MRLLRMNHWVVLCCCLAAVVIFLGAPGIGQTDSGTVSGRVVDPSGLSIAGAEVHLVDIDRENVLTTFTNKSGLYTFQAVRPGRYRMEVLAKNFKAVNVTGLIVNTQANLEQNFALSVGSFSESITVEAKATEVSTSVSTVVDRQFVENLPLNGRSFQSLIQLTPGVVVTPTSDTDAGQFSVNGQRASANYFMVDGVSANIGASSNRLSTQNASGAIPGFSVLGGTNNLVSVDALQEFRIQTSTYAPEFGRTPGAQVSIETRSGTNQFHGALFDYLRNDVLDASDWFNGTTNPPLKKSQERQNDFGGVLGGPLFKSKTFFFFSYEGEILRLPRTSIAKVPSTAVRQDPNTPAAVLPLLNAFPLPNQTASAADLADGLAPFAASFSDRASLNATSIRIDHQLADHWLIFGRYNYSPSELTSRGDGITQSVNQLSRFTVNTQTLTLGSIWSAKSNITNDLRFNYSRNRATANDSLDGFGGAVVPPDSFFIPAPFSSKTSAGTFSINSASVVRIGPQGNSLQRQINLVESLSIQKGSHAFKFGVDYRRLSPTVGAGPQYSDNTTFFTVPSVIAAQPAFSVVTVSNPVNVRFQNLGAYVQDTWKVSNRLALTYGVRWDVDFAPYTIDAPDFLAFTNTRNPDAIALAPPGAPLFHTRYANFAPRIGASYVLSPKAKRETILRGGFGVFYDLATQQVTDTFATLPSFPFGGTKFCTAFSPACLLTTFPLPATVLQPPAIAFNNTSEVLGVDPALRLPHTLQWNLALEQSLGDKQAVSLTYVGTIARNLIQQELLIDPNNTTVPLFGLIGNHAKSDYHALQAQYRRQMSQGLQVLASYTWSHSIDDASSSNNGIGNAFARDLNREFNRGPSDFDVRHSYSAGVTYDFPSAKGNAILRTITRGWASDNMIQGRTATPVDVSDGNVSSILGLSSLSIRPDIVPGQPVYLTGSACGASTGNCPGGKALNPKAFVDPPTDPITLSPLREGDLGRNALRGFGVFQWDTAVRRVFAIRESLRLEFRAEFFNVLNHPNFANPDGNLASPVFGLSTSMLNRGLSPSQSSGGFNPLYQIGGPRSGQLALKLNF